MYNNPYEEYMRNSLGYNQTPMMNMGQMQYDVYEDENAFTYNNQSVEDMYPEIYRIVYPMICKACMAVNENVTEDLVSRITNEIYMNVEHMEVVQNVRSASKDVAPTSKSIKNDSLSTKTSVSSSSSVRQQETRQRNPLLNDLIRILVLRELIGNPGRPRPPFRPPFGPGPGPRPPMPRQDYPYMF